MATNRLEVIEARRAEYPYELQPPKTGGSGEYTFTPGEITATNAALHEDIPYLLRRLTRAEDVCRRAMLDVHTNDSQMKYLVERWLENS